MVVRRGFPAPRRTTYQRGTGAAPRQPHRHRRHRGRYLLFQEARRRGMWAVTAGPLGFSTAWLVFSPTGMSFDDYIRHERPNGPSRLGRCVPGGAIPPATHLPYLDLLQVDIRSGQGPSAGRLANFVAASRLSKWLRCCWAVPRFGPRRITASSMPTARSCGPAACGWATAIPCSG